MVSCFICNDKFINNSGGQLTSHIKKCHNMTLEEYIILTEYNNIPPKCECGLCDDIPHLYRGKFLKYAKGHDGFKWRESKYIEKYGRPTCLNCGKNIGFYRGEPNKYCSTKCVPNGWNQETVRNTIRNKYEVNNLMELENIREKVKEKVNYLWCNNRDEILNKIKKTNLEKFGTEYTFQSDVVKKKQKETMMKNHGVEHYSKTEKFRQETSLRMFESNPMKIPEVVEKMSKTTSLNFLKWKYFSKKYKSTDLIYQSSYEYDFLEFCEDNNILHLIKRSPSFKYLDRNIYHYPDYLFNDEYIIEIKSKWVMDLQGGMELINEKIKSLYPYKYLLILDKDYYQFKNLF